MTTTTRTRRRVWAPEDKVRIVLESLNTNISLSELCRKYAISPTVFYQWREKFIQGGKLALSGALKDPVKEREAENERLKKLIGELTIANDAMRKVLSGEGKK
jgi:transposase